MPADDLRGRPPQRLRVGVPATVVVELPAQVAWPAARQQQAAQHRPERLRPDLRPELGGDRLRGRVRLLSGDAALLDREVRDVTGRIDVAETIDARVGIDGDEAVERLRQPVEARCAQARQRDDAVDLQAAARDEAEAPVCEVGRMRRGHEVDAPLVEQRLDCVATAAAEDLEGPFVRRHQRQVDALNSVGAEPGARHQRELVERQRPGRTPGNGESQAPCSPGGKVLEDGTDPVRVGGTAEGQRTGHRFHRQRSRGDEQDVVRDRADRRPRLVPGGVDALQGAEREGGADPGAASAESS